MQSTTGFSYFVGFASIISLFMSIFFAIEFPVIVPYFDRRGSRKIHLVQSIQVVLFMFLAASITVLTWSAVEPNIGLMYKALAILYIVIFLLYGVYTHKDYPLTKSSFQKYSVHVGLVFYLIMLPGLICFSISYLKLMHAGEFREIDMLIQDTRVEFDGRYPCSSGHCGAYKATFNVHWGQQWACPNNQEVWCDKWITEEECIILLDNSTTTQTEFATNAKQVEECIKEKYKLPAIGFLDKQIYPDLKDEWPEIPFFGTCSSQCDTEPLSTDMFQFAERVKLTALILSCSGAFLFFVYYCVIFGKDMVDVCNMFCSKSKKLRSLRHFSIVRFWQSDRVAPVGDRSATSIQSGQLDRNSEVSITPEDDGDDGSTDIETSRNITQTTPPPPGQPIMVEASILHSDDEEDYDDDDEFGSSSDEISFDEEEEESLDSSCYESLHDIDLSADPSYLEEESSTNGGTRCNKEASRGTSEADEVEIDV